MDNSSSSLSDDDRSDSWSIIDENNIPEDGIDFEIVKDLFENNIQQESTSSEIYDVNDVNVIPTVTTFPNKENREEINLTNSPNEEGRSILDDFNPLRRLLVKDKIPEMKEKIPEFVNVIPTFTTFPNKDNREENNLTNSLNKEETCVLEDFNPSTSSLRQRHIVKEKIPEFDVEKNDPKEKCTKRKRRFYKCPFIAGVSLGTILTVCGLSLILKSSEEIISCPENKNVTALNLNNTLASALDDSSIWPSILEEDRLIRKYCPNKYNRDILKNKNIRTKLLKRIDRKIKQQIRGYDVKASNGKAEKLKLKKEFIGPLRKDCCIQRKNENKSHSNCDISKQKAFIFQAMSPVKTSETNCVTSDKKEPCKQNNLDPKLNLNKALIVQQEENNEPVDKSTISTTGKKNKLSTNYLEQEESYHKLKRNIIGHNYKALQDENNKQVDIVTSLENRINTIKEENLRLSNIIKEQEKVVESIQARVNHKKRLYEKREVLQQNLENHLHLIQDRKILAAKRNIAKEDDRIVCALTSKMSDKLLDEMLLVTIKNTKTNNESDREKEYLLENNLDHKRYGSIEKKNEYQPNIPLMKRRDAEKQPKENLNIFLENQKLIAGKARKMGDEEHMKRNNQLEKCNPQKTWIRKRN